MKKLSGHFSLEEMVRSETAIRKGIDNTPDDKTVESLISLCTEVLDRIVEIFGAIQITSGYRSPSLNKAIGGSFTSQHCFGQAADFVMSEKGRTHREIIVLIANSTIEFDQMIYEFGEAGWIHISFRRGGNRRQVLEAAKTDVGTKYSNLSI